MTTFSAGTPAFMAMVAMELTAGVPTNLSFPISTAGSGQPITPRHARISVEGNPVRWGSNPNSLVGQFVSSTPPNNVIDFTDPKNDFTGILRQVQFVALNGPATLQVQYYT